MAYEVLSEYGRNVSFSELLVTANDKVSDFYASSWQQGDSPMPLLIVRLLLAVFALAILTWSLVEGSSLYWLIYLTSWGVLLVAASMMTGLVVSFAFLCSNPIERIVLPWYVSLFWTTSNIAVTVSVTITGLYWILLYSPDMRHELGLRGFWLDVSTHGFTSCIVIIELLSSRTPVKLAHIYQPLGLGLTYAIFTIVYYVFGGTDMAGNVCIYEVLNWQYPKRSSVLVICAVAALIILYILIWGLAFCRDKISINFIRTTSHDLPLSSADTKIP